MTAVSGLSRKPRPIVSGSLECSPKIHWSEEEIWKAITCM